MAHRTGDFTDFNYSVKEDPYWNLSRESNRNGRNVMLNADWHLILDLHDHAFLAELDNITNLDQLYWRRFGDHMYFLCTTNYLSRSVLQWNKQAQKARWKSLKAKGYVYVQLCPTSGSRYIRIDYRKIVEDVTTAKMRHARRTADARAAVPVHPHENTENPGPVERKGVDIPTHPREDFPTRVGVDIPTRGWVDIPPPKTHDGRQSDRRHLDKEDTMSPTPAASPLSGGTTVFSLDPKPKAPEVPTLQLVAVADTEASPLPSSAPPPPSRKVGTPPQDLSHLSDVELEELAVEDAEQTERGADGRKRRKGRTRSCSRHST